MGKSHREIVSRCLTWRASAARLPLYMYMQIGSSICSRNDDRRPHGAMPQIGVVSRYIATSRLTGPVEMLWKTPKYYEPFTLYHARSYDLRHRVSTRCCIRLTHDMSEVDSRVMDSAKRLTDWQRPRDLATMLDVTRLTIYRWIVSGRVQVKRLSARCIRVRLAPQDRGRTTEPKPLRDARRRRQARQARRGRRTGTRTSV